MRRLLLLAGLAAAVAAPGLASAQPLDPACVRSNQQTTATGAVLGALGGALIGSAIAGRHDRGIGAVGGAVAGGVTGGALANQHNDPCPQGYYRPDGPPPPPPGDYGPPPPGAYGPPPPPEGAFWRGAPMGIHDRIDFLYRRISDAQSSGQLGRRDARMLYGQLNEVRNQEQHLRYRDGGELSPQDRGYLQDRLNEISRRVRWEARD